MSREPMLARRVGFIAASKNATRPVEVDTHRYPARGSTMAFATVVMVPTSGFEVITTVGTFARRSTRINFEELNR